MTQDDGDTHRAAAEDASGRGGEGDSAVAPTGSLPELVERAQDELLDVSHVSSPDELPGIVAEMGTSFGGHDTTIYLADLQQRVLVPFRTAASHGHDAFP